MRADIEKRAAARNVFLEVVDRLDGAAIERAACIILADSDDRLPVDAPAVLAAGRILLVPRLIRTFGLQDGLDHLEFSDADDAITLVQAYQRFPEAFVRVSVWARIAARSLCC